MGSKTSQATETEKRRHRRILRFRFRPASSFQIWPQTSKSRYLKASKMFSPTVTMDSNSTQCLIVMMQRLAEQPRRRQVRFAPLVSTCSSSLLPFEDLKELWYDPEDLASFKSQAREIASSSTSDDVRGLEYCNVERQKHKFLSIRCTLSAQRKGMSPEDIAIVAKKCTAWSEEIAFVQGCHDYYCVYEPAMASFIPQVSRIPPEFPYAMKKRRASSKPSPPISERRVRRRVSV